MDPIAFQIGPLTVRWYGLLIAASLCLGMFLFQHLAKRRGLDLDHIWTMILVAVPLAVIGARLYYVIFNWSYYAAQPAKIFAIWQGGLAIHGAIILGALGFLLCCRYYKDDFWDAADCAAPALILGQAIGRWGNYFNQEAYGYVTDVPWAIEIDGALHHPTFLYESLWDFMIFIVLLLLFKRTKKTGVIFLLYLALYSVGRFIIEGFRTDSLMLGPLRQAQIMSILLFVAALGFLYYRFKKAPPRTFPAGDGRPPTKNQATAAQKKPGDRHNAVPAKKQKKGRRQ